MPKAKALPKTSPVKGFRFATRVAELRYKGRPDLSAVVSDASCVAAGVFTRNRVVAAPVVVSKEHLRKSPRHRAVLLNAGRANACTGAPGLSDARAECRSLARLLWCKPEEILLCSTGIIGQRIGVEKLTQNLPALVMDLKPGALPKVARAIMTTDTYPKYAEARFQVGARRYSIAGVAKGAGMIAPDMATLLSVIVTDAALPKGLLQRAVSEAADLSFNAITIDGDTSTNDTLLLLASGAAGGRPLRAGTAGYRAFEKALQKVALDLALQVARDGEGARKLVKIEVTGARTQTEARACAKAIAESPLVKTALAGEDPNWGRIFAAAGRSGARFDFERATLDFENLRLVARGRQTSPAAEKRAHKIMKRSEYSVTVALRAGKFSAFYYTCDFTQEYVTINADYRS